MRIVCKARDGPAHLHIGLFTDLRQYISSQSLSVKRQKLRNVATLIHPQIGIVVLKKNPPYNKLLHFLLTLQFAASSFPSRGVSLALDVSYISLFFLRGSFRA